MEKQLLLSLTLLVPGAASPQAQSLTIRHEPAGCAVADRFPRLNAQFAPAESVAAARIVFQSDKSEHWWAVAMKPEGLSYFGILPKPNKSLKTFRYYIEVTDKAIGTARTPDYTVTMVEGSGGCSGKLLTGSVGSASVVLQGPTGGAALPGGFASGGVVAAGGSSAAAGAASVAAAAGGVSTGLVIAGVGGAVAVAGAVAAKGEDNPAETTPSPTMAGRWVGESSTPSSPCIVDITYDFTQSGSNFSGGGTTQRRVGPGCTALNGTVEGTVGVLTGSTFTFSDRFVTGSQFCNQTGSGTLNGNRATGSTVGTGVGTGACNQTFTFTITRQ